MIRVGTGEATEVVALIKMFDLNVSAGPLHLHIVDVFVIPVVGAGDGLLLANNGEPVAAATFNMN